jgi:hypothetical protein
MCPVFLVLVHCDVVIINYTRTVHIYRRLYDGHNYTTLQSVAVQSSAEMEDACPLELHLSEYK